MTTYSPETQLQEYQFHPKHKISTRRWKLHRHEEPTSIQRK
jgi:hypothetical protein